MVLLLGERHLRQDRRLNDVFGFFGLFVRIHRLATSPTKLAVTKMNGRG